MEMIVFNTTEAAEYLKIKAKSPHRVIERLCRQGKIRAAMASKMQGYRIHKKALEDFLLLGGNR